MVIGLFIVLFLSCVLHVFEIIKIHNLKKNIIHNETFDIEELDNIFIDVTEIQVYDNTRYVGVLKTLRKNGKEDIIYTSNRHFVWTSDAKQQVKEKYEQYCLNFNFDKKTGLKITNDNEKL